MDDKDKKIIRGVLRNDKVWLRKFEAEYRPRLLKFILRKIGRFEDAEEIVQDTLASAIYSLPSFLGQSRLFSWLCGIAKHEIADFYRKKRIKAVLFSHFPGLETIASKALSPQMALEEKELREKILRCFFELAEGYREVLRLKYAEGLSLHQMAWRFKKTAKAMEMRLRRARQAFAKKWNETPIYPENRLALNPRNLHFFEECLGAFGSSLPDPKNH